MAVEVAKHPAAWPCDNCDCVDGVAPEPRWYTPGYIEATDVCYRQAITPISQMIVSLYPHYSRGHLYRSGGAGDQPALYLDAMEFLFGYINGNKN